MDTKKTINITLISLAIIGALFIFWWLNNDPTNDFTVNVAGADNRGEGDSVQSVNIGEIFREYETEYTQLTGKWPRFRGDDFDNISESPNPLIDEFGPDGPKIMWSVKLGEGHSGAAIYDGLAYILDYDEKERADMLRCFSLVEGKEMWVRGYSVNVKRNHGMSRTI
ncbi:MAG TPA: hypothetical protein VKA10_09955, partial [Prolixibacteraceae bacterium]|nr:hypothetical protein [Prolixibacteraceae bacterium]